MKHKYCENGMVLELKKNVSFLIVELAIHRSGFTWQ